MEVIILTGPAGAGKNTIAHLLGAKRTKCAIIDVDLVRLMASNPHVAPWENGEEGLKTLEFGAENACLLAKNFLKNGYNVIILDVLSTKSAQVYRKMLSENKNKIVLLLPTLEEVIKRNTMRPPRLKKEEIEWTYKLQENLTIFDEKIDNTNLSAEETAKRIYMSVNL